MSTDQILYDEVTDPEGLHRKNVLGWKVAAGLAVLTAVEFFVALRVTNALVGLVAIGLVKGWLILAYFMHIRDLDERS